jgi:hypothetical protein
MPRTILPRILLGCASLAAASLMEGSVHAAEPAVASVQVNPATLQLRGQRARFSLLIDGTTPDGRAVDLTHAATYRSATPELCSVSPAGVVTALADGEGRVEVNVVGQTKTVTVAIQNSQQPREFHFERDIVPILSRYGCNAAGCHGKAEGQNGFKLSVFGFDPRADHVALLQESRGRRVSLTHPDDSLLLT